MQYRAIKVSFHQNWARFLIKSGPLWVSWTLPSLVGFITVTVNLKSAEGLEFATNLVRASDVLLENFGAGVLDRLGLGYDAMQKINQTVIVTRSTAPYPLNVVQVALEYAPIPEIKM